MERTKKTMTVGLIVGNRGFFPDHLAKSGREECFRVLGAAGMEVVTLSPRKANTEPWKLARNRAAAPTCSREMATGSTE